ncbi:Putative zn(2)Cys(6) fungal-type DNA-binding domain-containing protein [Colletotrichum destructivum]|uniref:Zn(2)Cys(6) fungal-type DNA-binding domain-containing protein n=1 Tax=Colletotrichum destructivum TaxID=34406 RepID=A0AAX4IP41_9PEZI|nr:Putative zn(2)Cys(6) fungal-type DNA-binding domain-containing protein [Colletotrichum destructivum]
MTSKVSLAPLPKTTLPRKSRVCTREACEACRVKKAKCDGGKPCSRCRFRNEQCEYLARPHQTKRSLQAELERMKDAQHRRDTILGALTEPGQSQEVLRRLCGGETFETIYESLDNHDLASPTPTQTPDAQNQPRSVKAEEASWTPNQTPLCSPPILDYSYSHGSEASHVRSAISQHAVPAESMGDGGSDGGSSPHFNVFMPNNMVLPDHMNEYGAMDNNSSNTAMMPYGGFMDCSAWIFNPNTSYTDQPYTTTAADGNVMNLYPWQSGIPTPTLPTTDDGVPPVTDHGGWPFPPFVVPQIPSPGQASFLQPLTPSSPKNHSLLASPASSREQTHSSQGSSVASVGESRYPTPPPPPPPPKRRKYDTQANNKPASSAIPVTAAVASARTDCKTVESAPADEKKAQVQFPEGQTPPHDRERHRRASARNWQKQKQQSAELEAAMRVAEDRNRMLHREFAEIASQVMDAKNALIAHAQCNHPAINSWLRCHATDYVLNKGAAADRKRKE